MNTNPPPTTENLALGLIHGIEPELFHGMETNSVTTPRTAAGWILDWITTRWHAHRAGMPQHAGDVFSLALKLAIAQWVEFRKAIVAAKGQAN